MHVEFLETLCITYKHFQDQKLYLLKFNDYHVLENVDSEILTLKYSKNKVAGV